MNNTNWPLIAQRLDCTGEAQMWDLLYTRRGLSIAQLAKLFKCGTSTIRARLQACNVQARRAGGPNNNSGQLQKLLLINLQLIPCRSPKQLSQMLQLEPNTCRKYRR